MIDSMCENCAELDDRIAQVDSLASHGPAAHQNGIACLIEEHEAEKDHSIRRRKSKGRLSWRPVETLTSREMAAREASTPRPSRHVIHEVRQVQQTIASPSR